MSNDKPKKEKKPRFMRWYPEKWLDGSIRDEMTAAQRGVWADLLCLGSRNDPPGQVDFTSIKSLARRLGISQKLLFGTLKRAEINKKVRFIKVYIDVKLGQKFEDFERTLDQIDTFCEIKSKTGIPLNAIIFLDWDARQPPYYRQRLYPRRAERNDRKGPTSGPESGIMERRGDNRIQKEKGKTEEEPPDLTSSYSPLPSISPPKKDISKREEFLEMLKSCNGYPFNEGVDSLLFDITVNTYPGINVLEQTRKKIAWWRIHADALKADPRAQLKEWFAEEAKFKKRDGPQPTGEAMKDLDPDHRSFLWQLLDPKKGKKPNSEN